MKHLYEIRRTQLQQKEIRKKVFEAFDFIKQKMVKLAGSKLPEVKNIPRTGFKKESINMATKLPQFRREEKKSVSDQRGRSIEEELSNIQRKLDILNNN
jgi:hypothetical protein